MFRMTLTFTGKGRANLPGLEDLLRQAAQNAARASALVMTRYTIQSKFENKNPPYLNRKTGRAIRDITASPRLTSVEVSGDTFTARASYGTDKNVPYVKAHEFGGSFTQNVRAHTRRTSSGRAPVRAHDRHVTLRARHMFTDAISEKSPIVKTIAAKAASIVFKENRVPTVAELAASAG